MFLKSRKHFSVGFESFTIFFIIIRRFVLVLVSGDVCRNKPPTRPNGTTIKYRSPDGKCGKWLECLGGFPQVYECGAPHSVFSKLQQACVNPKTAEPPCGIP